MTALQLPLVLKWTFAGIREEKERRQRNKDRRARQQREIDDARARRQQERASRNIQESDDQYLTQETAF